MRFLPRSLVCVAFVAGATPTSAQTLAPASLPPLTPIDVFQCEFVDDPQISPDGSQIAFLRVSMDIRSDRPVRHLWLIPSRGGEAQPLTDGLHSVSAPRWSPDGQRIAYLADRDGGGSQLQMLWPDSGRVATLTQLEHGPGALSWSPDGRFLAFTMFVEEQPEPLARMPRKPEGAEWAEPPVVIEELRYRADGRGYLDPGATQVFVVSADGGTPRRLSHDRFDWSGPLAWLPDGSALIASANRRDDFELEPTDSELWRLSIAGGEPVALTHRYGPDQSPAVSPDGKWLAWTGFDDTRQGYTVTQLWLMRLDGSGRRSLTADLDRDAAAPRWRSDSSGLYFRYDDRGDTKLAFVSTDGRRHAVADQVGGTSLGRPYSGGSFSVSRDHQLAFTLGGVEHPADLGVVHDRGTGSGEGGGTRRLTALNDDLFATRARGEVEEFWTESSFDQRPLQGWVVYPPDFDPARKWPLLLEIHGGPFANYGARFSLECQLYAAAGYVVVYTNPRGSTSYGQEFGNLIHHAYPGHDYDDLMSCLDHVMARGFVDAERLYVTGGSGGGVLTAWIVGTTDRFAAAVVAKPVIDWTSFVLTADAYPYFVRNWFAAPPWEDPSAYWQRSPLSRVGRVSTPTMLMTGEADHRTPISQSEEFFQALKLREIPTAMVRIPGASHGITARPSRLAAKVAHVLAWFERYGGTKAQESSKK